MFDKKTILTGVKPTGTPHLGNYLAAIKPAIELAKNTDKHYMFIADYHAINAEKDPLVLGQKIKEVACTYLALGLNPAHSVFYRQSDIPEITEITTILYAYTPKGFMNKAHAYKACIDKNREAGKPDDDGINMGLYTYPTLMAADILSFDTDIVPVGKDQVQHVEIARDIAGAINAHYGKELLHLPEYYLAENVAIVPGVDGRKMSKSYDNIIPLMAPEKELKKKIMRIITDSKTPEEPKDPDTSTIYQLYKFFATESESAEFAKMFRNGGMGYGTAKTILFEKVNSVLANQRTEYERLLANKSEIDAILADGAMRARAVAKQTLERVKKAMLG